MEDGRRHTMGATPEDRVNEILAQWLDEQREGGERDPAEVIREHPELAAELRARFEALDVLHGLFEPGRPAAALPETIGRYRILRELGRGSMGIVYEAEQTDLQRQVALKVLSPVIANDAEAVARFSREAQAAARLEHRNIAAVHEFGHDEAFIFYSMELIEGPSLHDWIEKECEGSGRETRGQAEPDTFRWLARMFADVATGLQAAHDMDVIHRDIKPSNILLAPDGTPKVVDFGLARIGGTTRTLTTPGQVLGTLHYMSPEQATAMREELDARTDVYSLGASLYEALTLRAPFLGEDPVEIISSIVTDEPPRPCRIRPEIPRDLETITIKAMAKDRRLRYPTARELADDLERYLRDETIRARRPGPVRLARAWVARRPSRALGTAAALVVAVLAGLLVLGPGDGEGPPEAFAGMLVVDYAPEAVSALAAAGVPAEARIHDWSGFLIPGAGVGTAVAATQQERHRFRIDVCGFGVERELLWTARGRWPDYESTLGSAGAALEGMRCLVTRSVEPVVEESLLVAGTHHGKQRLFVADPRTGTQRGAWGNPDGFRATLTDLALLGMVPDWSDQPRRLMVGGAFLRKNGDAVPGLLVIELDGTTMRRYRFPTLGIKRGYEANLSSLKCDWSRDQPEVIVQTNENLFFAVLVKDRLLDLSSVRVTVSDTSDDLYDRVHGAGAFDKLVAERGGFMALLRELASGVREEGG
jgi:predicted Ser/Thr protein kinase